MKKPNKIITIEVDHRTAKYFQITAINRFFDNVEKAIRGDEECKNNLLAEDLPDAREYYQTVFTKIQDKLNFPDD